VTILILRGYRNIAALPEDFAYGMFATKSDLKRDRLQETLIGELGNFQLGK